MKTIWILNQYNMPPEYGHLNRHYNIAKFLKKFGYNPIVLVGSYLHNTDIQMIKDKSIIKKYNSSNFQYYFIKTKDYSSSRLKRVYTMFEYYINVFRISKKLDKPDVIIGSSAHPLAAIAAIKLAKKYGCKSIVEVRDLWPESFVAYNIISKKNPLLRLFYAGERWMYKKADKLIFTMEGGKDYIINHKWDKNHNGPIDINKVYHINNGIDLELFDYNKKFNTIEDEDLLDKQNFNVVYTGSIRLVNKVEKILDVAKLLNKQNIKFLLWGAGDEVEILKKRVLDEKIDNVIFKGYVNKKYIPYITSNADLNIIIGENSPLFRYGGSLNKMFDYFASGKPTLVTFTLGFSLINKYKAGIELDDSSPKNIAESILCFKNLDEKTYNDYCKNAHQAAKEYDFENLTLSLVKIIEQL